MILEKETFEKYGYYPSTLSHGSRKVILAACNDCGIVRTTTKNAYAELCGSCKQKGERNHRYGKSTASYMKRGEEHWNWKGGKNVKCVCKVCGTIFYSYPSQSKGNLGTYCSFQCHRRDRKFKTRYAKTEKIFADICKKYKLDFHYVGDSSLWIGKKGSTMLNPDFIEANGKKICVDVLGEYWHSPLINQRVQEYATIPFREKQYKQFKWTPVFIWETDLKRKDAEEFVLNLLEKEVGIKPGGGPD